MQHLVLKNLHRLQYFISIFTFKFVFATENILEIKQPKFQILNVLIAQTQKTD